VAVSSARACSAVTNSALMTTMVGVLDVIVAVLRFLFAAC
jgi:hypothetical protein